MQKGAPLLANSRLKLDIFVDENPSEDEQTDSGNII